MKRRLVMWTAVLALHMGACGGPDMATRRSTLIVSHRGGNDALSPTADTWAKFLVFLPLVSWDEKGAREGRLADWWEHSPDWVEWTYHLRTDARWHDGVPVTAHDVKFTLDLLSHPSVLYYSAGYIESVRVVDDSTVTIRSAQFNREDAWWTTYFPQHLLENLDPARIAEWTFWTRPVGNGPYRFVRHQPGTTFEFEANPDYHRGKPRIGRVVLTLHSEGRLTELFSGGVDAIATANPSEIPRVQQDDRFRVYQFSDGLTRGLYWKCDHPILRDQRVRKALTLAVDREELQYVLSIPESIPVVDGIVLWEDLLRGDVPPPLPYDPNRARALLEQAGWSDTDGDGILDRSGRPFHFTLLVQGRGLGQGVWSRAAIFVQDQLRDVGVDVELQAVELAVLRPRLTRGEFDAALTFFWPHADWMSAMLGDSSSLGYSNPGVAERIEQLESTADPEELRRIYGELITVFQDEAPVTFLGPVAWTVFAHRRLRGLSTPWRANPLHHIGELWLEDGT